MTQTKAEQLIPQIKSSYATYVSEHVRQLVISELERLSPMEAERDRLHNSARHWHDTFKKATLDYQDGQARIGHQKMVLEKELDKLLAVNKVLADVLNRWFPNDMDITNNKHWDWMEDKEALKLAGEIK